MESVKEKFLRYVAVDTQSSESENVPSTEKQFVLARMLRDELQAMGAKDVKMDEQVSEWINRLNNAMEELQKPFGHRVAQAIVAYIENYPKGVANGKEKELAFADQIEQRIMPKLRGIDLELNEEPLKKIGELIEETGDKTLYDAYRKGSSQDNTNGVFLWQGIDRSEDF